MRSLRRELNRLPNQGKIAGVCAGIAEHFGFETWLVRIVFVSGVLLSGMLFVVGYVAAWFILDVKPGSEKHNKMKANKNCHKPKHQSKQWNNTWSDDIDSQIRSRFESKPIEVKEKVWQAGEPPRQAFHDIAGQFNALEKRLQNLETYVTSKEFTVSREIDRL